MVVGRPTEQVESAEESTPLLWTTEESVAAARDATLHGGRLATLNTGKALPGDTAAAVFSLLTWAPKSSTCDAKYAIERFSSLRRSASFSWEPAGAGEGCWVETEQTFAGNNPSFINSASTRRASSPRNRFAKHVSFEFESSKSHGFSVYPEDGRLLAKSRRCFM